MGQLSLLAGFLPDKVSSHRRFGSRDALALNSGTGALVRGPMTGVRRHVYDYPWTTALLVAVLKSQFPLESPSSCSMLVNASTDLHRDPHNAQTLRWLVHPRRVASCGLRIVRAQSQ